MPRPRLYLLPGLSAPPDMFEPLARTGLPFTVLPWPVPEKGESFPDYLSRVAAQIDSSRPFVLGGVSFGGMCAVRLTEMVRPEKLLLISSVSDSRQFPFYIKLLRGLPAHKLIAGQAYKDLANWTRPLFAGALQDEFLAIRNELLTRAHPRLIRWQIDKAVYWRSVPVDLPVAHLHGTRDRVFPPIFLRKSKVDWLEGLGHHMILTHPQAIADWIREQMQD